MKIAIIGTGNFRVGSIAKKAFEHQTGHLHGPYQRNLVGLKEN